MQAGNSGQNGGPESHPHLITLSDIYFFAFQSNFRNFRFHFHFLGSQMCIQDILINYFVSKIFSYLWQKDFICCSSVILMELNVIFKIHRHYISDHLKQSLQTSVMVHLESNNRSRLHKSSFGLWKPT